MTTTVILISTERAFKDTTIRFNTVKADTVATVGIHQVIAESLASMAFRFSHGLKKGYLIVIILILNIFIWKVTPFCIIICFAALFAIQAA
jgi:hypothetical protein